MMFHNLKNVTADPLLSLIRQFREDTNPQKIDLGVGVYKNEHGETPVLTCVKRAEIEWLNTEKTKSYVGPAGDLGFANAMTKLVFGEHHHEKIGHRIAALQTPGGCGALRALAELIKRSNEDACVWVSDPTWANHEPLLGGARLRLKKYPYYCHETHRIRFDAMMETLSQVPSGDIILLHGCCHNPSGADLTPSQWMAIVQLMSQRGLIPLIDVAYQGFGVSLEEDAYGVRLAAEHLPEVLVAVSCSKNFGLYRERVGCAFTLAEDERQSALSLEYMMNSVRGIYSMPPSHGAAVVSTIMHSNDLKAMWHEELVQMSERIRWVRNEFIRVMNDSFHVDQFQFICEQKGMFSFLGISEHQVKLLASEYGIYMAHSSRISLAGLNPNNMDYFCSSLVKVLSKNTM